MNLERALKSRSGLTPIVLPDLDRLISAKRRVLERWPDIVPDAPVNDHEKIIARMLNLLKRESWEDVKTSFVFSAMKVAFSESFRNRPDVSPIIDFAFEEIDATTRENFLNGMVAVYISSYEPNAKHSLKLGKKIRSKSRLLNGKWQTLKAHYPSLFDASNAHIDIAKSMVDMSDPWQELKANGFTNPHATGLMDAAHCAYVDLIAHRLHAEDWLETLFKWLNPESSKRKVSGSIQVIESVLRHWTRTNAPEQTRQLITEQLIKQYNDPRTKRSLWVGVDEKYMNVIFSWLTREDLRFFTSVVDATQKDHQWEPRKRFWLQLYDEGLIEQAWVAFCPSAERYARQHLTRNSGTVNLSRFARQTCGGSRSDTSILIMKIGGKVVVDGCHNYRTHIFNINDPAAPELFRLEYDCDLDVMQLAPWSKAHNSIPSWSKWVRESIHSKTPMSTKKPRQPKKSQENNDQFPPATVQPKITIHSENIRTLDIETETKDSESRNTTNQKAEYHHKENQPHPTDSTSLPSSNSSNISETTKSLKREIMLLSERIRKAGKYNIVIHRAMTKAIDNQVLTDIERRTLRENVEKYSNTKEPLLEIKKYLK